MLKHPNMWAVMCAHFTYLYCLRIFLSWLPSYLVDFRRFTLLKMGYFASLPLFAGVMADTLRGWLTDILFVKTKNINRLPVGGNRGDARVRRLHPACRAHKQPPLRPSIA